MDKYIKELVTEMLFDATDLAEGDSFKDVGYDSKKEYFDDLKAKLEELEERLKEKGLID
jgi:hypothetical protein